jgi:hypothetical protein
MIIAGYNVSRKEAPMLALKIAALVETGRCPVSLM